MPAAFVERLLVDLPGSTLETMARIRAIERSYLAPACSGDDVLKKALCTDIGGWLPDNVLMKIDRATMAHSLEARVPFLDYRVVELAMRMPSALKWRHGKGRTVLRSAFEDLIGQELAQRQKQGFALPLDTWLRNELKPLLDETLGASGLRDTAWVSPDTVGRLIGMHDAGRSDVGRALWTLYVLVGWFREAGAVSAAARPHRSFHV
jgi:asparagine synthase (glutamine-hydrolysing)